MHEERPSKLRQQTHIKDARGRKVTQLDPVALQLLRRHDIIEADVLRATTSEKGVRMSAVERGALVLSIIVPFAVIGAAAGFAIAGHTWGGIVKRFATMMYCLIWPFIVWGGMKRSRFGRTAAAMLKHLRCPHCGYDIRGLRTDPADGATVCPECGCAWRLGGSAGAGVR